MSYGKYAVSMYNLIKPTQMPLWRTIMSQQIHLLIIDPQNDFCDLPADARPQVRGIAASPALPVSGGDRDMKRLADFVTRMGPRLRDITVTLDSHPHVAIERTTFWKDRDGQPVAPFTLISADRVAAGDFVPASQADLVLRQLRALERAGRYQLVVWPVHCVTGTWGHNIHAEVAEALAAWELQSHSTPHKVLKGEYPWSEHYGAFEAEVPLDEVPWTQFNMPLAQRVTEDVDLLLVAGLASSHCVAASVDQLLGALPRLPLKPGFQVMLLSDCMSPVGGFEAQAEQFLQRASAAGVQLQTAQQVLDACTR
ncbi:Isochorismatase-like domain-containing protein [Bordetella muralis]